MPMYPLLHQLLSDIAGGPRFTCFGLWHFGYLLLTALVLALAVRYGRRGGAPARERAARCFIDLAFGLYLADFFLMPFAYGEILIEKLPFHACTAMCVACFWSSRSAAGRRLRVRFALLGLLSNLVYLIYPAGVMWSQVHPLSYQVIQTLLFHGCMVIHCLLVLYTERESLTLRTCHKDLLTLVLMTLWAVLGTVLYSGEAGDYAYEFNWFFVARDPFEMFPEAWFPFFMPLLNVAVFFAAELAVYGLIRLTGKKRDTCQA